MTKRLEALDDGLWVAHLPRFKFLGLKLGTRMTVLRLADGSVLLYSPIALDDELCAAVNEIGPVRHILAPNRYHHLFAGDAKARWPEAMLLGAPGLAKKRKDLSFEAELGDTTAAAWAGELESVFVAGTMLGETVLLHRPTRTVIGCDLTENFETSDHWPTRAYLKLGGIHGEIGLSKPLRWMFRDRAAARDAIDRVLAWDFDRVVIAHGAVVETGGHDALRATYAWL